MEGKLNVRSPGFDAHGTDDRLRRFAHALIIRIGQGQYWGHRDGIAGMDSHGIEILNATNDFDVVIEIPNDFEFKFFPSEDAFFDENLTDG